MDKSKIYVRMSELNESNLSSEKKMSMSIKIDEEQLSQFSADVKSLWAKPIPTIDDVPSPVEFLREYVHLSMPVLIKNAFPICTMDDISDQAHAYCASPPCTDTDNANGDDQRKELTLNVDVSPDGHADTIRIVDGEKMFVMPEVREMSLTAFKNELRKGNQNEREHGSDSYSEWDENGNRTFTSSKKNSVDIERNNGNLSLEDSSAVFYYSRQVGDLILVSLSNTFSFVWKVDAF